MKNRIIVLLGLVLVFSIFLTTKAIAQTGKRVPYKNEQYGISFDYDASYKLEDYSTGDRFKVVLERETFFIYLIIINAPQVPNTTYSDQVKGFHDFSSKETAGKNDYRISEVEVVKKDIAGRKAYTFNEYYSFDKGPMTNHFIFMDFPFRDKVGLAMRARTLNTGQDFQLANDEMIAVLASMRRL